MRPGPCKHGRIGQNGAPTGDFRMKLAGKVALVTGAQQDVVHLLDGDGVLRAVHRARGNRRNDSLTGEPGPGRLWDPRWPRQNEGPATSEATP